ncbi:MAG: TRAP transporter small permease [Devosia sp.]|nr:TRAP transporter small permease [Devosia sp.]
MTDEKQVTHQSASGPTAVLTRFAIPVERFGEKLALLGEILAVISLCALILIVVVQTIMSMLASYFPAATSAMSVSWEYAGYLMGTAFMFGLSQTLRLGGHIRVNLIFDGLRPAHQRIMDLVATVCSITVMVILAQALTVMTIRSITNNSLSTASLTPLWIPQGAFAFASWLFALQLVIRAVSLMAGRPPEQPREYVGASAE